MGATPVEPEKSKFSCMASTGTHTYFNATHIVSFSSVTSSAPFTDESLGGPIPALTLGVPARVLILPLL